MNRKHVLVLMTMSLICASTGLHAQQGDAASTRTDADRIGRLEKEYQALLAELDWIKRQGAEPESVGMTQKDQWGQGYGLLLGVNQIALPSTVMEGMDTVPFKTAWILPGIDLEVGIGVTVRSVDDVDANFMLRPKLKFAGPLMFNFTKTYWGFGAGLSADFFGSEGDHVDLGRPSLFTGMEVFSEKNRSFYWETGVTAYGMVRCGFGASGITFSAVANPPYVAPYIEMGLRFYF